MPLIAFVAVLCAAMTGSIPMAKADSAVDAKAALDAFERQDFKGAIVLLDKVLADKSVNPQARAAILVYRGGAHHALGQTTGAIADFNAAIAVDPQSLDANNNLGFVYEEQGKYDLAIKHRGRAVEIVKTSPPAPETVAAYNAYAWLLATCPDDKLRNAKIAVEAATTAGGQLPSLGSNVDQALLARTYDTIGAVYAESKLFKEAVAAVEKGIEVLDGGAMDKTELEKHLASYRAGKPWRLK